MVSQTENKSAYHGLIRGLSRSNYTLNMVGGVLLCLSDYIPILHTVWLDSYALTLKNYTAKYYEVRKI